MLANSGLNLGKGWALETYVQWHANSVNDSRLFARTIGRVAISHEMLLPVVLHTVMMGYHQTNVLTELDEYSDIIVEALLTKGLIRSRLISF